MQTTTRQRAATVSYGEVVAVQMDAAVADAGHPDLGVRRRAHVGGQLPAEGAARHRGRDHRPADRGQRGV